MERTAKALRFAGVSPITGPWRVKRKVTSRSGPPFTAILSRTTSIGVQRP